MVYFQLSKIGYNCGLDKQGCSRYPEDCNKCIAEKLRELGFEVNSNIRILEMDSEEKRQQMFRDLIWQKFWDVVNIKHILIMTKSSGVSLMSYPVSGAGVDINLLTGFIQANISFSQTSESELLEDSYTYDGHSYEFQYKKFNILLKEGTIVRICLVLDNKASQTLRTQVLEFLRNFEAKYRGKILRQLQTGVADFDDVKSFISEEFNVKLVFPMILAHTIPPDLLESIESNPIQKAIVQFAKELLNTKQFFFINNILYELQNLVKIEANIILYEIYQLLELQVIIPTTIESAEEKIKYFQESRAKRIAENELISSIITGDDAILELKEQMVDMDEENGKKLMESFIKKGQTAEKALVYQEAQKEYEKALYIATGFDLKKEIGKISFLIFELDKKMNEIEIDYAFRAAESAEKKKDYINAIRHYQKALELYNKMANILDYDSKISKLEKKIAKLQKQL